MSGLALQRHGPDIQVQQLSSTGHSDEEDRSLTPEAEAAPDEGAFSQPFRRERTIAVGRTHCSSTEVWPAGRILAEATGDSDVQGAAAAAESAACRRGLQSLLLQEYRKQNETGDEGQGEWRAGQRRTGRSG